MEISFKQIYENDFLINIATWTVVNEGNNQVRLHNNNNFLAVINGNTVVINMVWRLLLN